MPFCTRFSQTTTTLLLLILLCRKKGDKADNDSGVVNSSAYTIYIYTQDAWKSALFKIINTYCVVFSNFLHSSLCPLDRALRQGEASSQCQCQRYSSQGSINNSNRCACFCDNSSLSSADVFGQLSQTGFADSRAFILNQF